MRSYPRGLFPLFFALTACGVDETEFIPGYADYYCDTLMECTDPAILQFDGIDSKDTCLSVIGPALEDEVGRCDYSPKNAKRCLKAMEGMGCPGDDKTVDDVLPTDCSQVSTNCSAPKDTSDSTGGTSPTGTGGGTGA